MDNELVRKITSVGDLVERSLINEIKLKHFDGKEAMSLKKDNEYIWMAIKELVDDIRVFEDEKRDLFKILQDQWDVLDKVHDDSISMQDRGAFAISAQKMNRDRMKYKNQINSKAGSSIELKSYGVK